MKNILNKLRSTKESSLFYLIVEVGRKIIIILLFLPTKFVSLLFAKQDINAILHFLPLLQRIDAVVNILFLNIHVILQSENSIQNYRDGCHRTGDCLSVLKVSFFHLQGLV